MKNEPESMLKKIIGNVLMVLAFIGAFMLVKHFKQEWHNEKSMTDASKAVTSQIEAQIQEAQSKSTQNKTATEILMEESNKQAKETINNTKTQKDKLVAASNMFFGAYFLNTRTRPEYCSSLGVDITSFVKGYKKTNQEIFAKAEKLQIIDFEEHNRNYNEDKFYSLIAPANNQMIKQDMKDTSAYLNMSETELCQSFEQNSVEWSAETDLRKRAPEITNLLMMAN